MKKISYLAVVTLVFIGFYKFKSETHVPVKPVIRTPSPETPKKIKIPIPSRQELPSITPQGILPREVEHKKIKQPTMPALLGDPKEYVPFDEEGNIYISDVVVYGKEVVAFGDIIVDDYDSLMRKQADGKPLLMKSPKRWEKGIIPYIISNQVEDQIRITQAINYFSQYTNVKFIKRTDQKDYVNFISGQEHCFAHMGKIGGMQKVSLSLGCGIKEIIHELMHTLGFYHEQCRPDRNDFLQVLWENIEEKYYAQFKKFPPKYFDFNKFPFDFNSIMLYPATAFAVGGDYSLVKLDGTSYEVEEGRFLSPEDIKRVNFYYPKRK